MPLRYKDFPPLTIKSSRKARERQKKHYFIFSLQSWCCEVTVTIPTGWPARKLTPEVKGTDGHYSSSVGGSHCVYKVTEADSMVRMAWPRVRMGPGAMAQYEEWN